MWTRLVHLLVQHICYQQHEAQYVLNALFYQWSTCTFAHFRATYYFSISKECEVVLLLGLEYFFWQVLAALLEYQVCVLLLSLLISLGTNLTELLIKTILNTTDLDAVVNMNVHIQSRFDRHVQYHHHSVKILAKVLHQKDKSDKNQTTKVLRCVKGKYKSKTTCYAECCIIGLYFNLLLHLCVKLTNVVTGKGGASFNYFMYLQVVNP